MIIDALRHFLKRLFINITNGFVDEGQGYSITLTATEMEGARIVVYVVDQRIATEPKE